MKSLFIALANSQKVVESAKIISAYKENNPFAQVTLLVNKEQFHFAQMIRSVDIVQTVDVKKIKQLKDKPIYSDAYLINSLLSDLEELTNTTWDHVHNFSNNNVSAYLTSYFKASKKTGAYFNDKNLLNHSNTWSAILNTQVPRLDSTITQLTAHNQILGSQMSSTQVPLLLDEDNLAKARTMFSNLRGNLPRETKILGVSLMAHEDHYEKIALLEKIIDIGGHYPVLITSFDEKDREFAEKINSHFDGAFVLVEVDHKTIPCLMVNIDLFITDDHLLFAMANALDTPIITNIKNSIKTTSTSNVYFIRRGNIATRIEDILEHYNTQSLLPLPDITYAYEDHLGISLRFGEMSLDIKSYLKRLATFSSLGVKINDRVKKDFARNFSLNKLKDLSLEIKEDLSKSLKVVLAAIRMIKQYQTSDRYEKAFWAKLSQVFALENQNTITKDFVSLFCTYTYNIDTGMKGENLNQIETQLYQLKNNIQLFNDILTFFIEDESERTNSVHTSESL